MKKLLSMLALVTTVAGADLYAAESGDIYEVAACTQIGGDISTSAYPLWAKGSDACLNAGETAYFRIRLVAPEDGGVNYWSLVHLGGSSEETDMALYPPQICIFVSGKERWARLCDVRNVEVNGYKFTDCIFKYTTKPGDFALPLVLGAVVGGKNQPALDPTESAPHYAIDLRGKWQFKYVKSSMQVVEPNWWISASGKSGVERIADTALVNAGFNVQTVDFSSTWETNSVVWRSVHQDTSITVDGLAPQIVRKSAADESVSLYVWSTNENAVVVSGPNVEEVECDPKQPGVKFHVAKITIGASISENAFSDFTIRGVSQSAAGGWSGLVLSSYNKFNKRNSLGEAYEDYMVVPVRCVEPLPPSVIVEADRASAYATSDYKTCAARLTVKLSQPVSQKFKVCLNPKFEGSATSLTEAEWGEYVRFSKTSDVVASLPDPKAATTEVELGGNVNSVTLYMFVLRGDEKTVGEANKIAFEPVAVGSYPTIIQGFSGVSMNLVAQNPEIVAPAEGEELTAIQFDETPVTIRVSDTYADMASDDGYEIFVKYHPSDTEHAPNAPAGFKKLDGKFKPGDGGVLERCDDSSRDMPSFVWDTTGEYETEFYVVAPVSGNKSCGTTAVYRKLNVIISKTKSVSVTTADGDNAIEADEGDQVNIRIELSEETKVDLYAFLQIMSDDVSPQQFSSSTPFVIGMSNTRGLKINKGNKLAAAAKLKLLDGYGPATGEYLNTDFEVVLATVQDYDTATSSVPSKIVKGYESSTFSVTVNNVEPRIKRIELNGFAADVDGYEYNFKLPKGQNQELQAFVDDPSTYDLNNDFQCRWQISVASTRNGTYIPKDTLTQTGNPNQVKTLYTFPYTGWNKIVLQVKDKDMDDWKDTTFAAFVEVLSNPGITVEPSEDNILETAIRDAYVKVGLTYYDAEEPIYVKLTVSPVKETGDSAKDGEVLLDETLKAPPPGYMDHAGDNVYFLTFNSDAAQDVTIQRMDGTSSSDLHGFWIRAEVINLGNNPKTSEPWTQYYTANLNTKIHPRNMAPNNGEDGITFSPDSNPTSRWEVAGGAATQHPLSWRLRSDVEKDFEAGITVTITGGGGSTTTYYKAAEGTFIPDFGTAQGDQQVTITIADKDGGSVTRTWYFTVTASKFLTTIATAPSGGTSTLKLSQKYVAASGIGEGHVYAAGNATFNTASDFRLVWNCSSEVNVPLYAWGYKIEKPTDNGTLDTHDQALESDGSATAGVAVTSPYVYKSFRDGDMRDSFFYAWLMPSAAEKGEGAEEGESVSAVISPERPERGAQAGSVDLPTQLGENSKSWPMTTVEAIFSKEYYASDNMGDINMDRIPDLYFTKYNFSQSAEVTDARGTTSTEETTVDDIKSLSAYNDDKDESGAAVGDYLPASLTASFIDFSAALANPIEFSAVLEIRGLDDHLNNAPAIAGVTGVKPVLKYIDPNLYGDSTLSPVEYLAWVDYAYAHEWSLDDETKWSQWTPENPTDPTLADTDGDGFNDGFEYYFWYRAHVGYMDGPNHVYLTGRRFNPRHPSEGDFIPASEIEKAMNPTKASNFEAKVQDTDNDGLPDVIEFYLGTNPFDFDTDRDGLPDGWEIMVAGTSPIKYATDGEVADGLRNADGDAMAFTTAKYEAEGYRPKQYDPLAPTSFALADDAGDSDGVQWYVVTDAALVQTELRPDSIPAVTVFEYFDVASGDWIKAATKATIRKSAGAAPMLAKDLNREDTFKITESGEEPVVICRGLPIRVLAGTQLRNVAESTVPCAELVLTAEVPEHLCNAAWIYGTTAAGGLATSANESVSDMVGFGQIAVGRSQKAPAEAVIVEAPSTERSVAYLHYLVYQEFGFDPRTAWNPFTPLNARWGAKEADGTARDGSFSGYAGIATRTRAFTAYDEFLTLSFLMNNGVLKESEVTPSLTQPWSTIFAKFTTNPRGPGETAVAEVANSKDEGTETAKAAVTEAAGSDNGADTDGDGVPDGWELYVMAGPKVEKQIGLTGTALCYNFVASSELDPWQPLSQMLATTDGDGDGLTELNEFSGTDTTAYYTEYSATVNGAPGGNEKWINKFFPTDPWGADTDQDGLADGAEIKNIAIIANSAEACSFMAGRFIYGEPVDDGSTCIPGGGLNPCAIDTDLDGLPDVWEAQYAGRFDEANGIADKNHGIVNGMDGTVKDAYTRPWNKLVASILDGSGNEDAVNRDYDRDGLENWQEYLTGTMRCWRYDDPISRWDSTPKEAYFDWNEDEHAWVFNIDKAVESAKLKLLDDTVDEGRFWYETLVNTQSPIYNPYLVMDQSPVGSQYFTRVKNGFDPAFTDAGTYYFFYDGVDHELSAKPENDWFLAFVSAGLVKNKALYTPMCYMGTSPIEADSDHDGMDDYYELFHGMNPLLGAAGVRNENGQPCDLVYHAWCYGMNAEAGTMYESPVKAWRRDQSESLDLVNTWTRFGSPLRAKADARATNTGMDFTVYPWLNGMLGADPDGDDIRNEEEAIQTRDALDYANHTDPTPLWMTDSSYSNSLVRLFFRMPARFSPVLLGAPTFTSPEGDEYKFCDFGGYTLAQTADGEVPAFGVYNPDKWAVAAQNNFNWVCSFEENEGYDTDHDGVNDSSELSGKITDYSSPLNADAPMRRQAMYFPGDKSALQTMPRCVELSPLGATKFDTEDTFRHYTVECWAYPESDADSVVIERAVWGSESGAADEEFIRKNFQIAIKSQKWFTKFDTTGTKVESQVFVDSGVTVEPNRWVHLAATYDGESLRFYVNGISVGENLDGKVNKLWPENGRNAIVARHAEGLANEYDDFSFGKTYSYCALIVGASLKTYAELPGPMASQTVGRALDLTEAKGWDYYTRFFKGYVDEVRIWDGARSQAEISGAMRQRFTAADAVSNRAAFYDKWLAFGYSRYSDLARGMNVLPELRHHYSFDSVFGADNVESLAQAPVGFLDSDAGRWSRPDDWVCGWWKRVLDAYGSRYADPRWVTWVPDTMAHLPRIDGTTGDSAFWSQDFAGGVNGNYGFARDAEPVSLWTQYTRNFATADNAYRTTAARHQLVFSPTYCPGDVMGGLANLFNFAGRTAAQCGDDLLPLGGAFVKFCDNTVGLWDKQGASANWEITGYDSDSDGLPDWWEAYADGEYRLPDDPQTPIAPSTYVLYNGVKMTAREAYLRDLARGAYADKNVEGVFDDPKYRQLYDLNANGLPDWWENIYGLANASALDDSDHDGLSNYVEYMLSEVFRFDGFTFSPTDPFSVNRYTPDYFFRIGKLYAGEIFTDHDLVDDEWEDQYAGTFASRLVYDAFANRELDGWCNRSKVRYSKLCMPIIADRQRHMAASGELVSDYPVPTIALTLRYNGRRQSTVESAPMVVKFVTGELESEPDASYKVEVGVGSNQLYRVLGKWSDRHMVGTLTPGSVMASSMSLQACDGPSATVCSWKYHYNGEYVVYRGTIAEYEDAVRKYGVLGSNADGSGVEKLPSSSAYSELVGTEVRAEADSDFGVWVTKDGTQFGTINLATGEFDLDLGVFKGWYGSNVSNRNEVSSFEDKYFRIAYKANPLTGLPRQLYLGEATVGHVREGKNMIIAFADLDGDGEYSAGEPYGVVRNVEVSWRGTSAEIELTDVSPVTPRISLVDAESDRGISRPEYYDWLTQSYILPSSLSWMAKMNIVSTALESSDKAQHIRVVRWLVDGNSAVDCGIQNRVVLDKYVTTSVRSVLTEADIFANGELDLDWKYLNSEVVNNSVVKSKQLGITNVTYLVVTGDARVDWWSTVLTNYTVTALDTLVTRKFGKDRVLPEPVSAGEVGGVVRTANPTFTWKLDCPDEEGYPAFRIQVLKTDAAKTKVYDSGILPAPARNGKNEYVWAAPLFVGDKTQEGVVFDNNTNYSWKVAMYNAKFSTDVFSSDAPSFRMAVQTNGWSSGKVPVAVRYFGPAESFASKQVRVRAYTSPDFTGTPVAAGYVAQPADAITGLAVTNRELTANCTLIGLPPGTYYLQAFIDSNANGVCDEWETMGYFCQRNGTTADYLNPVAVKIANVVGEGDLCEIFLEDADTDGDGLPDAWEFAMYGNLTTKGVEELNLSAAGEFAISDVLTENLMQELGIGAQDINGGLAAQAMFTLSNAGAMALALGSDVSAYDTFAAAISAAVSNELVEDGVIISSLAFDENGDVVIEVEAQTEPARNDSVLAQAIVSKTMTVKCDVYWKASLADVNWIKVGETQTITVGAGASKVPVRGVEGDAGFFRVSLYK